MFRIKHTSINESGRPKTTPLEPLQRLVLSCAWCVFHSKHKGHNIYTCIFTALRWRRCLISICAESNAQPVVVSQWTSCQIRKFAGAHAPGMPGTFSPWPQVSDPDMHHGTCVTHVPWCMPGSLTSGFLWNRRRGETFPAFPAHAQPAILPIWKEAHIMTAHGLIT